MHKPEPVKKNENLSGSLKSPNSGQKTSLNKQKNKKNKKK